MKFGLLSVSYRSQECPHEPGSQRLVQNQQVGTSVCTVFVKYFVDF